MLRENMLFVGLWFGEKKIVMWIFLRLYMNVLKEFELGVEFELFLRGRFFCKVVFLVCICDLFVRCFVCNSM